MSENTLQNDGYVQSPPDISASTDDADPQRSTESVRFDQEDRFGHFNHGKPQQWTSRMLERMAKTYEPSIVSSNHSSVYSSRGSVYSSRSSIYSGSSSVHSDRSSLYSALKSTRLDLYPSLLTKHKILRQAQLPKPGNEPEDYVFHIENYVFRIVGCTPWFKSAFLFHPPSFIEARLARLLTQFSSNLIDGLPKSDPKSKSLSRAAQLVRTSSKAIARHVRVKCQTQHMSTSELRRKLAGIDTVFAFERLCSRDFRKMLNDRHLETNEEKDENETPKNLEFAHMDSFLFGGNAFLELCANIREDLYESGPPAMALIKSTILYAIRGKHPEQCSTCTIGKPISMEESLSSCDNHLYPYSFSIRTEWKPLDFLSNQFGSNFPALGSIITYTGIASCALASTCSEYIKRVWPSSGTIFLDALESLLFAKREQELKRPDVSVISNSLYAKISLSSKGELWVKGRATKKGLVELAQQVSWISSAMQLPTSIEDQGHVYCTATLSPTYQPCDESFSEDTCRFSVKYEFDPVPKEEHNCWLGLVSNTAVIAHHFPVPNRHNEKGLEIPLNILAHLADVHHVVEFQGGIVMKGPASMLLPVSQKDGIIQWHLVSSPIDDHNMTYQSGVLQCPQRALLDQVSMDSLHHTRAVVGWCGDAVVMLGLDEINYENLEYSDASFDKSALLFSGVAIGIQQFGAGQASFRPGPKDYSRRHKEREGTYRTILDSAARTKVLLYDTAEQRAWLVKADEVILHMIQKQRREKPFLANGHLVELSSGKSASETLYCNRDLVIWSDGNLQDTEETFRDLVKRLWSLLETHVAWEVEIGMSRERSVKVPLREELSGYEFMAITEERSPYVRKARQINKSNGGWTRLMDDIRPLVLFASGFEDLILPNGSSRDLCHIWRSVPKGKDYMATTIQVLQDLYYTSGHRLDRQYLTSSGLRWHQGGLLFEPCKSLGSFRCSCDRLQQIFPKSSGGTIAAPGLLLDRGAVIFGRNSLNPAASITVQAGTSIELGKGVLYSQTNGPLDPNSENSRCRPYGISIGKETDMTSPDAEDEEDEEHDGASGFSLGERSCFRSESGSGSSISTLQTKSQDQYWDSSAIGIPNMSKDAFPDFIHTVKEMRRRNNDGRIVPPHSVEKSGRQ